MDKNDLKINAVEKAIGKGNGTVRKTIQDENPNPKLDTLVALAKLFGTTVSYLIGETDEPGSGKLVLQDETHLWDYLLPLSTDEVNWIAVKRFVESHADKQLDDKELEERVDEIL